MRNALAYATHKFFQDNGFVWVSSPIITASDCEGAGEQFYVTTLVSFSSVCFFRKTTWCSIEFSCCIDFSLNYVKLNLYPVSMFAQIF